MIFKRLWKFLFKFAVAVIMASALSYSVTAAEIDRITVLGDSISAGYGLSEEDKNYGTWLGEYFSAEVKNFAVDGKTTTELLESLEVDSQISESVENSDLICISIGGNDILDIFYDDLISIADGFISPQSSNFTVSPEAIQNLILSFSSSLGPASAKAGENIGKIADKISEINPKAKLIFQTVYNPFETNDDTMKAMYTPLYTFTSIYLGAINNSVKNNENIEFADIQRKFKGNCPLFTNIEQMDIHPNNIGHLIIAEEIVQKLKIPGENEIFQNGLGLIPPQKINQFPSELKAEIELLANGQFRAEEAEDTFSELTEVIEETAEITDNNNELKTKNNQNDNNSTKKDLRRIEIIIRLTLILFLIVLITAALISFIKGRKQK